MKQFFLSIAGAALVWTGSSVAQTDRGGKSSAMAAHYLFDTDPGGTARDLSGAQNNGKILKARFIERAEGRNCLRFDASSIIQCGDAASLQLQGDTTVELWVRQNEGNISDPSSMLFGQMEISTCSWPTDIICSCGIAPVLARKRNPWSSPSNGKL